MEAATYVRQGDHHVGHWRTFLVDCELHAFTFNDHVDSWLVHPPKSVVVDNTDHTLVKDLRRMLERDKAVMLRLLLAMVVSLQLM